MVVLDLGLSDTDGVEVVHGLRGWTGVPIIILSARDAQDDKVNALDAGSRTAITEPFWDVRTARQGARRPAKAQPNERAPVSTTETFTIDLAAKLVTRAGKDVDHRTRLG